jgi:hypothetical protein
VLMEFCPFTRDQHGRHREHSASVAACKSNGANTYGVCDRWAQPSADGRTRGFRLNRVLPIAIDDRDERCHCDAVRARPER